MGINYLYRFLMMDGTDGAQLMISFLAVIFSEKLKSRWTTYKQNWFPFVRFSQPKINL